MLDVCANESEKVGSFDGNFQTNHLRQFFCLLKWVRLDAWERLSQVI